MVRRNRSTASVSINPRSAQNMSTRPADFSATKQRLSPFKVFGAVGALISIITCLLIQLPGLDASGTRMFGIFLAAILLWVTGQADQSDTIKALNQAGLDYYIAKPWDPQTLRNVVREQLTDYVLETGIDPLPYMPVLDGVRIMESIR